MEGKIKTTSSGPSTFIHERQLKREEMKRTSLKEGRDFEKEREE